MVDTDTPRGSWSFDGGAPRAFVAEALQQGVPPAKLRRRSSRESGVEQLLKGKVAIITGGASGMGKAASILFAREGANVVVADLNVKGGEDVAAEAAKSGNACVFHRTDVSDEAQVKALVARAVSEFGGLDIMFNNAGIGGAVGPLEEIS
ncbi:MAG: SDR family NAD(P)-dependent oxidoreductase, partial [Alphaproteobacteria bacterium]|nr:SDR family NAD(P)-dependent oxidoreductase [Alphaproteobacteria bacterium]